jgi:diguanylate cyclase (GGDEF)-like protein
VHFPGGAKYLCIPLAPQGETLGILYIQDRSADADAASPEAQFAQAALKRLAIAAATRVSLALANLRLREMLRSQSIRDPLTGLFNRRYMEECLNRELHRAQRTGRKLSLVMLDLDHFKHFNDTFGHQVGDFLLKEIAGLLKNRVRGGDLACRFGGEEFSLIIAEVDSEGTIRCVENIREAVRHLALQHRGQTLGTITVSAGIAVFPEHGGNPEDLVRAADEALYRAKKSGRDRIVIYEPQEAGAHPIKKSI